MKTFWLLPFFLICGLSLPSLAISNDCPDCGGASGQTPLPTETWWEPCRQCANNPVLPSCVLAGKENYKPEVLFEVSLKPRVIIDGICADQKGQIYLLVSGPKPKIQVRNPDGKLVREFSWIRDGLNDTVHTYEIRVDENGDVLVLNVRDIGTGQIYDSRGNLRTKFKYNGLVLNAFTRSSLFKAWFKNGTVFVMKDGSVVYRNPSQGALRQEDGLNTLQGYEFEHEDHPKEGLQVVKFRDGKIFKFPAKIGHDDFWSPAFVDDAGNLYGYYETLFYPWSYVDGYGRDREEEEYYGRIYKFDRNMNLLAGFQFDPDYIDPATQTVYFCAWDDDKKVFRIIRWAK